MLQRFLLLWLVLLSLIGAAWTRVFGEAAFDPFIASAPHLGSLVALTMFCVGAILPPDELALVARRWPLTLAGTAVQYLSMPLLAWGLVNLIPLPDDWKVGVILTGCVPGAMASNVLTMVARGNVSYSVGLTTSATLLSPLVVPLVLKVTMGTDATPSLLLNSSKLLVLQVVLPAVAGFALSRVQVRFARLADRYAATLANLAILWIIAVVVARNRNLLPQLTPALFATLALLNVFGYAAGWAGGTALRLDRPMQRALILEVGMQNAGLGASLATTLFPGRPGVALPCGLFAFGCMFTGTILAKWFGSGERRAERRKNQEEGTGATAL